jgi:hypothetical protein
VLQCFSATQRSRAERFVRFRSGHELGRFAVEEQLEKIVARLADDAA